MLELKKYLSSFLTIAVLCNIMMHMDMIKKAILKEMKRRGWTCYRLSQELKGKLPQRTVYAYLSDKENSVNKRDISVERASIILKTLGLIIKR